MVMGAARACGKIAQGYNDWRCAAKIRPTEPQFIESGWRARRRAEQAARFAAITVAQLIDMGGARF
jgi:hypothetical protein